MALGRDVLPVEVEVERADRHCRIATLIRRRRHDPSRGTGGRRRDLVRFSNHQRIAGVDMEGRRF